MIVYSPLAGGKFVESTAGKTYDGPAEVQPKMPRFSVVFLFAVLFPLQLSAQAVRTDDPRFTVTSIAGPQEVSAGNEPRIAVGDGTAWLLTKHELLKVNPKENRLVSVPVEQIKMYNYGQPVMKVGGGS